MKQVRVSQLGTWENIPDRGKQLEEGPRKGLCLTSGCFKETSEAAGELREGREQVLWSSVGSLLWGKRELLPEFGQRRT